MAGRANKTIRPDTPIPDSEDDKSGFPDCLCPVEDLF